MHQLIMLGSIKERKTAVSILKKLTFELKPAAKAELMNQAQLIISAPKSWKPCETPVNNDGSKDLQIAHLFIHGEYNSAQPRQFP